MLLQTLKAIGSPSLLAQVGISALSLAGQSVAAVGLDPTDMNQGKYKELGPWMISVFVAPAMRGKVPLEVRVRSPQLRLQGYSKPIVRQAVQTAKELGLKELYLWTSNMSKVYASLGNTGVPCCALP